MHLEMNRETKCRSTKLAAAMLRGALTLAVLSALLVAARPVQAQTNQVLYSFAGTPDGSNPTSRLTFNGANLFGTTYGGGAYGNGSVFELTPNGSGGWTETLLYSFCPANPSCVDGANPAYSYVTFDSAGNLYGTAFNGGANGQGVVFELSPNGTSWTYNVLYSFANIPDGANPVNGLVMDTAGNLYGTTYGGGTAGGNGTVFEMTKSGSTWTESPIYDINSNGSGVTMNSAKTTIYGTGYQTVFQLVSNGTGGWIPSTIYTFNPANAAKVGSDPTGNLAIDSAGNLYGTTLSGGAGSLGTVYKLTLTAGKWVEKLLYSFSKNGTAPFAGVVFDSNGNILGTTKTGGKNGAGGVYELSPSGSFYIEHLVFAFIGINGAEPLSSLILDSANHVYGTTYLGGSNGDGTVFEANAKASTTTTTVTSSVNPSTQGEAVTFTATVTSAGGTPANGDIVVFEPVGQSPIVNGVATYTTSILKTGTTKITAVFEGDINFIGSKSAPLSQVVNP